MGEIQEVTTSAAKAPLTDKQLAARALERMPESVSLEKISEELAILASIRRGQQAADEGRVVSHEEAKQKINRMIELDTGGSDVVRFLDPRTNAAYVLVPDADFERVSEFLREERLRHAIGTVGLRNAAARMDEEP